MTQAAPLQTSNAKPKQSEGSGVLLQRKCACGSNASGLTGKCEECGKKRMLGLQRKLAVSEPGDKYEQEADRIADTVMRMPVPAVQRQATGEEEGEELLQTKPLSDQITPLVQRQPILEDDDDEEEALQTKASGTQAPVVTPGIEASIQVLRQGGGQPLDPTTRASMEPRFGHDFSQVRVHTGHQAAAAASLVSAHAFTIGRDVVFGAGHYAPATLGGQRLLAHELTHTLQQGAVPEARSPQPVSRSPGNAKVLRRSPSGGAGQPLAADPLRATCPADSTELDKAVRYAGLLERWAKRAKDGLVENWIKRLEERKLIAVPALRRRRACRVLLLAATPEAELTPKAKFAKGLDPALLDHLRRFVEMLAKPTVPESAVEGVPASPAEETKERAEKPKQEAAAAGTYADAGVEKKAKALRADFGLGNFGAGGTLEGESITWTANDLSVLERAFARTSSAVRTLVLRDTGLQLQGGAEAGEFHAARLRDIREGESRSFMLDIAGQQFRGMGDAAQVEAILHEVGHGIHFRRQDLLRSFTRRVREGALSSEETLRQVGGRTFGQYLVDSAAAGNTEYFAHSYAVFLLDANRLPTPVHEWAETNFP